MSKHYWQKIAMQWRVGQGYDIHRLVPGRPLILGGIEVPYPLGLEGHSDADVLLHAVMDALLGAAGMGDIGQHFPDYDSRWQGADSAVLLRQVVAQIRLEGFQVLNLDATIVAQAPKLASHLPLMRAKLAKVLRVSPWVVNIKAKTHEHLGSLGRGEGIAAQVVVLVFYRPTWRKWWRLSQQMVKETTAAVQHWLKTKIHHKTGRGDGMSLKKDEADDADEMPPAKK